MVKARITCGLSVIDIVVWGAFSETAPIGQQTSDGASCHLEHPFIIIETARNIKERSITLLFTHKD